MHKILDGEKKKLMLLQSYRDEISSVMTVSTVVVVYTINSSRNLLEISRLGLSATTTGLAASLITSSAQMLAGALVAAGFRASLSNATIP